MTVHDNVAVAVIISDIAFRKFSFKCLSMSQK